MLWSVTKKRRLSLTEVKVSFTERETTVVNSDTEDELLPSIIRYARDAETRDLDETAHYGIGSLMRSLVNKVQMITNWVHYVLYVGNERTINIAAVVVVVVGGLTLIFSLVGLWPTCLSIPWERTACK